MTTTTNTEFVPTRPKVTLGEKIFLWIFLGMIIFGVVMGNKGALTETGEQYLAKQATAAAATSASTDNTPKSVDTNSNADLQVRIQKLEEELAKKD